MSSNERPEFDKELQQVADYVLNFSAYSELAMETAYYCLLDSLGCALLALNYPACQKVLGPVVPGVQIANGVPIPGTEYCLDPVQAAFNIGTLIRWLDYNDTWLAAEWGHPSDNLGALLAVGSYLQSQGKTITIGELLQVLIKAYEVQGVIALENSFNAVGLDHVLLVKVASTACTLLLLGATREQLLNGLSLAWVDGQSLRTYRHAPNTGSRKSWAAGDATSRGVRLALLAMAGEMGYPSVLSAPTWGFYDVSFKGKSFTFSRDYGCYVMENILFKIAYPAEFHSQTAVECALALHPQVKEKLQEIERIELATQAAGKRIIDKTGPLHNPADRDHCLQYIVGAALVSGELSAASYEDDYPLRAEVDKLRELMVVVEDPQFTEDYFDSEKRAIPNRIQVFFKDGSHTPRAQVDFPIGHRYRREQGIPLLLNKFKQNLRSQFTDERTECLYRKYSNFSKSKEMTVEELLKDFASV